MGMAIPLSITKCLWHGRFYRQKEAVLMAILAFGALVAATFCFYTFERQASCRFHTLWNLKKCRRDCAEIQVSARTLVGELFCASCIISADGSLVSSTTALDDFLNSGRPLVQETITSSLLTL